LLKKLEVPGADFSDDRVEKSTHTGTWQDRLPEGKKQPKTRQPTGLARPALEAWQV
jgi:hypothetical protein